MGGRGGAELGAGERLVSGEEGGTSGVPGSPGPQVWHWKAGLQSRLREGVLNSSTCTRKEGRKETSHEH